MTLTISPTPTVTILPDDAEIITSSFPADMIGGGTYAASLTVKNTGGHTWSAAGGYALATTSDCSAGTNTAGSVVFEGFEVVGFVEPGVIYTFSGFVTAPAAVDPQACVSTLQMAQNAATFGDIFAWNAGNLFGTISPTPSPTATPQTPSPTPTISLTPTLEPTGSTPTISPTPTLTLTPSPTPVLPVFVIQPRSIIANAGQSVSFSAFAVGEEPLSYQWFRYNVPVDSGVGSTLHLGPVESQTQGTYRCDATNPGGTARSENVTLTVNTPPLANGAEFFESTLPPRLAPGDAIYLGVTMRNVGGASWSAPQGYSLAVVSDAGGLLGAETRFPLPDGAPVVDPSGGLAQFILFAEAPASPGTYTIELRMVEEAVEFFGDTATLTVDVAPRPNAARDWESYE